MPADAAGIRKKMKIATDFHDGKQPVKRIRTLLKTIAGQTENRSAGSYPAAFPLYDCPAVSKNFCFRSDAPEKARYIL